jgi:hypothetical protein
MGLLAKDSGGGSFELTPAGNHIGVCYMVCDLGDQDIEWQGTAKVQRKVRISWELPGELMQDGRPFSVSKKYTLSLSDKANLRKDLESWRGRAFTDSELEGFDLFNVIGKACMINVIHETNNGKTYANVASVASLPKGVVAPQPCNQPVSFSLDDEDAVNKFNGLPDWLQKLINTKGLEAPRQQQPAGEEFLDDDIPF